VRVNRDGLIDSSAIAAAVTDQTALIAVHLANHDIGVIQPIRAIADVAAERGVALYVDAEAAAGWLPIDVRALGIDLLSFSPHRFYGPKGVGVLYRNRRVRLTNLIHGGAQEGGRRAGTENIPAIAGAGVAADIAVRELDRRAGHTARLQQQLWAGLLAKVPYIRLNGPPPGPGRLSTQLNFSTEFVEGEGLLLMLDTRGIAVASGTSCVSKSLKMSHVLSGIGLDQTLGLGAILMTLGQDNTRDDIEYVLETFPAVVTKLRAMSPTWDEFERGAIDSVITPRTTAGAGGRPC
jgi:cysteine desulfurase